MKIQFNLATYKYENKRVTYPLFFFFLFITVLFTLYNLNKYDELQRDLEKSHQKIGYIKNNLAKKDLDKNNSKIDSKELSRLRTKIEFFNQLMNSMNFSYLRMLNYLEDNLPLGVRLKRLDFNIDKRSLSIVGETMSHEKMILFLENLEASPNFERNFLSSQSKQKKGGREKLNSLISFNLTSFIKEVN